MEALDGVVDFARRWHAGAWSLDRLPDELGVEVREQDGDPKILGLSLRLHQRGVIVVNTALSDSPLRPMVVGHECCHHLLKHGTAFCNPQDFRPVGESAAWYSLAILAVPERLVHDALERRVKLREIAELTEMPIELVRLACQVHRYRGMTRTPGRGDLGDALLGFAAYLHDRTYRLLVHA